MLMRDLAAIERTCVRAHARAFVKRERERAPRETAMFSQPPRASNHDNRMAGRHGSSSIEAGVFLFLQNRPWSRFKSDLY